MQPQVHPEGALPLHIEWQALSAARIEWPHVFEGATRFATKLRSEYAPGHDLVAHAVVVHETVLIAYASVLRPAVASLRGRLEVFGLSSVYTFPGFRGEGAGRRVVAAAEAHMRAQGGDVGMLFCGPDMAGFYGGLGWARSSGATSVEPPDTPAVHRRERMVRLLSARAEAAREALLHKDSRIGPRAW